MWVWTHSPNRPNISTLLGSRSGSNLSQSVPIVFLKLVGLNTFTTQFPPLTWLILQPSMKTGLAMNLHRSVNTFHYYFYIFIMGWPILVKCLLWGLIVLIQIHGHRGCFEEERMGLIEIKEFVRSNGNDVDHLLHSWINDPKSECCDWEWVICDLNTCYVVELFLHNVKGLSYFYSPRFKYYFLRNDRDNYSVVLERFFIWCFERAN